MSEKSPTILIAGICGSLRAGSYTRGAVAPAPSRLAQIWNSLTSPSDTRVEELWHTPKVYVHFGSMVRIGDYVYASSGHSGPALLTAVELKTGRIIWQTRDFAKAHLLGRGRQANHPRRRRNPRSGGGVAARAQSALEGPGADAAFLDRPDISRKQAVPARSPHDHGARLVMRY
jgi:hypothetical protein